MKNIAIVYFSGYGHTAEVAKMIAQDATTELTGVSLIAIDQEGEISDQNWVELDAADAIILGSPTYMGGPAWQFKKFADATSKRWYGRVWQDKLFSGFTNSASLDGDKRSTLEYFITLSQQQGGIWVGLGLSPSSNKNSSNDDINRLGGSLGLLISTPADATVEETLTLNEGTRKTIKAFATRIVNTLQRLR